jgi:hypothetical protein
MRQRWFVALLAVVALSVGVRADNPHFIRSSASLDNDGSLVVAWKEAGLGQNVNISYIASADATGQYQCVNNGGKCPQAANKEDFAGPVVAEGTFSSGKNGSITASLTVEPPPTTLQCPGNQVVKLANVSYTNIVLKDATNNVVAPVPTSLSATFFNCGL